MSICVSVISNSFFLALFGFDLLSCACLDLDLSDSDAMSVFGRTVEFSEVSCGF